MGGLKSLFANWGRKVDAAAQNEADKIASENAVDFGKQDIAKLKSDVESVKSNIGSIKGEIAVLKDKKDSYEAQIKKHDADALALETVNPTLSQQHLEAGEGLERQVESLKIAIDVQEKLLAEQMNTRRDLESSLQQVETDLVTLKAMTDAAAANEKLAQISSGSGTSALATFKQRQEEAKKRLIKSQTMKESTASESLEEQTRKALGASGASSRLAKLKQQQQQ
jgi:phage shock protein A